MLKSTDSRLTQFANATGTIAPEVIIDEFGVPSAELLIYCRNCKLSLDWLFLGEHRENFMMKQEQMRAEGKIDITSEATRLACRINDLVSAAKVIVELTMCDLDIDSQVTGLLGTLDAIADGSERQLTLFELDGLATA